MKYLVSPSKFSSDWYGWLTNQVSHIGLGLAIVFVACFAWLFAFGEFPYRLPVWVGVLAAYVLFELIVQGWRGWDTAEDTLFVCFYGAGGTLYVFREVEAGSAMVNGDLALLMPFFYVAFAHLFAGAAHRLNKQRKSGKSPSKG